jgi:hypothetical protein
MYISLQNSILLHPRSYKTHSNHGENKVKDLEGPKLFMRTI